MKILKTTKCGPMYKPIIIGPHISDVYLSENTRLLKKLYNGQTVYNKNRLYKSFMTRIFIDLYK